MRPRRLSTRRTRGRFWPRSELRELTPPLTLPSPPMGERDGGGSDLEAVLAHGDGPRKVPPRGGLELGGDGPRHHVGVGELAGGGGLGAAAVRPGLGSFRRGA